MKYEWKKNVKAIPFWSNVITPKNVSNHNITEINRDNEDWIVHDITI